MSFLDGLTNATERLIALQALRKKIDPAAGLSVMVRNGPLAEAEDDRDDSRPSRRYIELEVSTEAAALLDVLIRSQKESLDLNVSMSRDEHRRMEIALDKAIKLQGDSTTAKATKP